MREKQKKKKGRTWAEAAKTVLEKYPNTPMSHKEILQVIQREGLKEIRSGTSPLACLNAMLHTNSRGEQGIFYKVPGRMGVYTLKKDVSDSPKELSEDGSEESSDIASDSQSTENSNNTNSKESRKGKWRRRVASKLQSQPASPQSRCTSPSVPPSKLISPSQKHSKKALKQALKQQQQRNQRRQGGISSASSSRLILKTVKDMADPVTAKSAWEMKQSTQRSTSPQNSSSSSSSSSSVKTDLCPSVSTRKMTQRSDRLSARQLKRTKCAEIDVETPDSILVNTNLRALINKHTLSVLPTECQQRLLALLPEVDRQTCADGQLKLSSSALNNEFFTSAAQSWKERLAEGEFTPEMRLRIRQEFEKEKKMEQWKEHFFESYYGQTSGLSIEESKEITEAAPSPEPSKPQTPPLPTEKADTKTELGEEVKEGDTSKDEGSPLVTPRSPHEDPEAEAETAPDQLQGPERPPSEADTVSPKPSAKAGPVQSEEVASEALPSGEGPGGEDGSAAQLPPGNEPKVSPGACCTPTESPSSKTPEADRMEVTPEPLKRKSPGEEEVAPSPEKRPRVSEPPPPQTPPRASPENNDQTAAPKVPPLKIPYSRIVPVPAAGGQVSPRAPIPAPLTSPGRTGARTLADIKAKAHQARLQRAAAAAAAAAAVSTSEGTVPGPGPGGGGGETGGTAKEGILPLGSEPEPRTPSFRACGSGTQLQPATQSAASRVESPTPIPSGTGTTQAPPTSVTPSRPAFSTNPLQADPTSSQASSLRAPSVTSEKPEKPLPEQPSASSAVGKAGSQLIQKPSNSSEVLGKQHVTLASQGAKVTASQSVTHPSPTPTLSQKIPENPLAAGPTAKASSSITSNNPLVTKLLQGKEVPLDQILPKAHTKVPPVIAPSGDKGKFSASVPGSSVTGDESSLAAGSGAIEKQRQLSGQILVARPCGVELVQHQREMLNKATQEQILHTLMQRAHGQQFIPGPQPPQHEMCRLVHPSHCPSEPRFSVGFLGRKRLSRPAMSGHYLLNISTYGRGSESGKRAHLAISTPLANLKTEYTEGEEEEAAHRPPDSTGQDSDLSGVKTEHQEPSDGSDETPDVHQQLKIKSEFSSLGHQPDREISVHAACVSSGSNADPRTKEMDPVPQSRAGHPELGNNVQGNSISVTPEPYRQQVHTSADGPHPRQAAAYRVRKASSESQVPYGHPLNHSPTETGTSPSYSPASSSGSVMSFSVTVTAIPTTHGGHGEAAPIQAFTEGSGMDDSPSKCYCRLKAMIMCKGCGAFCHDDCIGPSKLCVSCLVVR
ncbi:putative Polycomb group protein ASXL2 isoform X2 [Megalops cyprinoides]|uniref:putative Polycomb group protein ASXL2 isoform X2 n=1 Tax=Megalops cyprinoides TaxID=118141 RepID=UPI001863EDC0|nr:putative Polycomb group protein ASXL2 isoform X2 [Megalops cyprinoides]